MAKRITVRSRGLVGASGRVVGIDSGRACIDTARSIIASFGLIRKHRVNATSKYAECADRAASAVDRHPPVLIIGDVNAEASEKLAESRLCDPQQPTQVGVAALEDVVLHALRDRLNAGSAKRNARGVFSHLRRIASMLRPGGRIVVQEPLRSPTPRSSPPFEALTAYWELLHQAIESAGVPHDTVDNLPAAAHAAGLDVVARNGFFIPAAAPLGFDLHASTLAAAKTRAIRSGAATAARVDKLVSELRAAADAEHDWVTTQFYADFVFEKPLHRRRRNTALLRPD